jgi:Fe-S oxidoreductase
MTAARENEGPVATRLFTGMEGVKPAPAVPKSGPDGAYSDDEAVAEAKRCLQCECLECVKNCLYLERFKGYPKRYVREIYNNETIVLGSHAHANRLLNQCSLCGLCGVLCPNDVSMADVCLEGRRSLVRRGKMPPSVHDFALRDMNFNNTDHFALTRAQPGTDRSEFMFFPGCQLSGSSPGLVERTYDYLRQHAPGGIGLMLRCCGAPAYWAGRDDLFREGLEELRKEWEAKERPNVVLACPTCYKIMKEHLPDIKITSLWELLDKVGLPPTSHPPQPAAIAIAIHDPCTSRFKKSMQASIRSIVGRLGYKPEEIELSGDKTECCGYGGLMSSAEPGLARDVAKRRAGAAACDWVTYCAMCRDSLAASGKPVVHVLDLIFHGPEGWRTARRRGPGYSERHENRSRLREKMLSEVFGEGGREVEQYERIVLHLSPEVRERMEERRILVEDVQKVIDHAEKTGNKISSRKTGHWLASFKPHAVTYWAEYSETPDGYEVHNAYSHRMEIVSENSI